MQRERLTMNLHGAVLAVTVFVSLASLAAADDADERKKLAGVWQGAVVTGNAVEPGDPIVKLEITITAEDMKAIDEKKMDLGTGTHALDLKADPHTIDATRSKNPGKGQTFLGIYKLDGDTLTWCVSNPRKPRPAEFVTKGSAGQYLLVLKRKKE